jgi:hypothetical protein
LIFVAHSFGGLIVQKALVLSHQNHRNYRQIVDATTGIIFLGIPTSNLNNTLKVLFFSFPSLTVEDKGKAYILGLSVLSELLDMQKTFEELERKPKSCRLISFFEELPTSGFGFVCHY